MKYSIKPNKQFSYFYLFVIILGIPIAVWAGGNQTSYYVDAISGNDSWDGKDSLHGDTHGPWKTINKVNNSTFNPGDQIFFKKGETWHEQLQPQSSGNSTNKISFNAYGSGNKPIITVRDSIPGWQSSGNWQGNGYTWHMHIGDAQYINRLWLSGIEKKRANSIESISSNYPWFTGSGKDIIYIYATSNPCSCYSNIEIPWHINDRFHAILLKVDNIKISNLDLRAGVSGTICLAGADSIIIEDCDIGKDANAYGIRGNEGWKDTSDKNSNYITIRRNNIESGFLLYYNSFYPNLGGSDGINLFNGANNWQIYNNTIQNWYHACIHLQSQRLGGDYSDSSVTNNLIYSNLMTQNDSISYGRGFDILQDTDGCTKFNKIYYNLIKNTTVRNQVGGYSNSVFYNIIDTIINSPVYTWGVGQGISLERCFSGSGICRNNNIYNNVIHATDEAGIIIGEYGSTPPIDSNKIINNIIFNTGRNSLNNMANIGLIVDNYSTIQNMTYKNNIIYKSGIDTIIVSYRGIKMTVSTFNGKNGQNGDIISGNIQSDPLFTNSANGDFTLTNNSPGRNTGVNLGTNYNIGLKSGSSWPNNILTDNQNNHGSGWEIGAYIYDVDLQPSKLQSQINDLYHQIMDNLISFNILVNTRNKPVEIRLQLPEEFKKKTQIKIYDVVGKVIKEFVVTERNTNFHWNGVDNHNALVPNGIYFVQLRIDNYTKTKKIILLQ